MASAFLLLVALSTLAQPFLVRSADLPPKEQSILLQLKKEWDNFDGSETWLAGAPCLNWTYVTCDETGHVTQLIAFSLFVGTDKSPPISPLIGELTSLTSLDLANNGFSGPLPAYLGNLLLLEELDMSANSFSGPFPPFLSKLKNLRSLSLSFNNFEGPIPSFVGSFVHLDSLDLSFNNFTEVPSFQDLRSVTTIDLSHNIITSISSRAFASLPKLNQLRLDANRITVLPDTFTRGSASLSIISLDFNPLTGLPLSLSNLPALTGLGASYCSITQPLPASIGNIATLESISLKNNSIPGSIPASWGKLSRLNYLDLSVNRLVGKIPDSFGSLAAMSFFYVHANELSGVIPPSLSSWKNIIYFGASHNKFTGPLPSFPKAASAQVDVSYNYFTGPPKIRIDSGTPRCGSTYKQTKVIRNCLTSTADCAAPKVQPLILCNRFCGTLSPKGQCGGHGVCLYAPTGLYCECAVGYKQSPTNKATCVKKLSVMWKNKLF